MNARKNEIRDYLRTMQTMLKMNYFIKLVGIPQPNFSRFMKSEFNNYIISLEKLEKLLDVIHTKLT